MPYDRATANKLVQQYLPAYNSNVLPIAGLDYRNKPKTTPPNYIGNAANALVNVFNRFRNMNSRASEVSPSTSPPLDQIITNNQATSANQGFNGVVGGQTYNSLNDYNAAALNQFLNNQQKQREFNQQANQFLGTVGGQNYTNYHDYIKAVRSAAQSEHDRTVKEIERAYQSGLIDFGERQKQLDLNRQNIQQQAQDLLASYQSNLENLSRGKTEALQTTQGAFSRLSPNAYQSQQAVQEGNILDQYNRGVGEQKRVQERNQTALDQALNNIGSLQSQLGRSREEFGQTYQSQLANSAKSLQDQLDQLANAEQSYEANRALLSNQENYNANQALQAFRDQLANNLLDYQNKLKAVNKTKIERYDPTEVLSGLAKYYQNALSLGYSPEDARSATDAYAQTTNIPNKQRSKLLEYLYNTVLKQPNYALAQ